MKITIEVDSFEQLLEGLGLGLRHLPASPTTSPIKPPAPMVYYKVILLNKPTQVINTIKVIREQLKLGLFQAKEFVDSTPCTVIVAHHPEAYRMYSALMDCGCHVQMTAIRPLGSRE